MNTNHPTLRGEHNAHLVDRIDTSLKLFRAFLYYLTFPRFCPEALTLDIIFAHRSHELALINATTTPKYTIAWRDDTGAEHIEQADTLADLATALDENGYTGSCIRVTDTHGFTRGWVAANDWKHT